MVVQERGNKAARREGSLPFPFHPSQAAILLVDPSHSQGGASHYPHPEQCSLIIGQIQSLYPESMSHTLNLPTSGKPHL